MQVTNRRKNQKGMAVIMTALTMLVCIPLVGLAVDVSVLYMIRGKLYQAVDAAALAGARALANGTTTGAQASSAQAAATTFFNANFPSGYWATTNVHFSSPTVDSSSVPNYRTVTTSATVSAPLYFLRILGQNTATIAASSQAGRRDVVMMLVLDRSSSMNLAFQGTTACAIMKADAAQFLNYFAPGRDMVGLVVFGSSVFTYAPTTSFTTADGSGNSVVSLINNISCGGNTNTPEAMYQAYQQLVTVNSTTRANVVVLMTDGRPNGFTGDYISPTNLRLHPTTCANGATHMIGVAAQWAGGPVSSGTTAGLMQPTTNSPSASGNDGVISTNSGCNFASDMTQAYKDFSLMPNRDTHGNSTTGNYSVYNTNAPYNGMVDALSISVPAQVEIAATNALDNQCTTIRQNTVLKPNIYTIALEGNDPTGKDTPDTILLRKLANDEIKQLNDNRRQHQPDEKTFDLIPDPGTEFLIGELEAVLQPKAVEIEPESENFADRHQQNDVQQY